MNVTVIDTETANLEGGVCEIAGVTIDNETISGYWHSLTKPGVPISFKAMGVHHISESMVENKPPVKSVVDEHIVTDEILVAHNAKFDSAMLEDDCVSNSWVCTMRCAQHLLPDSESFSNQSLRYEHALDLSDMPDDAGSLVHRALYDAWTTAKLFLLLRERFPDADLLDLTKKPVLLKTVGFGKHFGDAWSDVPHSYLRWAKSQDFDEDTLHTINHYFYKKGGNRR